MDTDLAPIDVAQHWPFLDRKLIRQPPAVRRALWLVAVGQVESDGVPCPVRASALRGGIDHPDAPEPWVPTGGAAGHVSVVLRQLEDRGVLVGYRGRGRRPHHWSFRPRLERWEGFHWEAPVGSISEVITECFCRAVPDLVARFPGQRVLQLRERAKFELLSRDHITPPGLFLVENEDKIKGRATKSRRPGANPVDTRDNAGAIGALSLLPENSENSLWGEEEDARFERLKGVLEFHARAKGQVVQPNSVPEGRLRRLARELDNAGTEALAKHFDRTAGEVQIPSGSTTMERMAEPYLPKVTTAL